MIEDFLDGKSLGFVEKNLGNKNVTIKDYINYVVESANFDKTTKNKIAQIENLIFKNSENQKNMEKEKYSFLYNVASFAKDNSSNIEYVVDKLKNLENINQNIDWLPNCCNLICSIVANLAHPYLISQYSTTCVATSIEFYLCKYYPKVYTDVVLSLYDKVRKSEIPYKKVKNEKEGELACYYKNFSASLLFQRVCTYIYYNDGNSNMLENKIATFKYFGFDLKEKNGNVIDKCLNDEEKAFIGFETKIGSKGGHAAIILSTNKDNNGNIISYNLYHGWNIYGKGGRLDVVPKRFLDKTISDFLIFTFDPENINF